MRFCSVDKIFEFPLDLKFTPGDTIVMVKKICRRNFSMYLEHISSPSDVKKLSLDELKALCGEIRGALVEKLSRHGGHCGYGNGKRYDETE